MLTTAATNQQQQHNNNINYTRISRWEVSEHLKIQMLRVFEGLQPHDHELEHGLEVFRGGRGDEDVRVSERHRARQTQTDGRGLASATRGGERDGGAEGLLGNGIQKAHEHLGLVHRL